MSCVSWNAYELESSRAIDELYDFLSSTFLNLVFFFLVETKLHSAKARYMAFPIIWS